MEKNNKNTDPVLQHDIFNIISIFIIIMLDFQYLCYATEIDKIGTHEIGNNYSYMGNLLISTFSIYMLVDTLWIAIQPKCVLSNPVALIVHHIASFLFLSIPYFESQFLWHAAITLFVEVNTFLLIVRRRAPLNSLIYSILDYSFLLTWMTLRLVVFPILVVFFAYEYIRFTYDHKNGNCFNIMLLAPLLQSILTLLGFKWTFDMVRKMITKFNDNLGKEKSQKKIVSIQTTSK